MPTRRLAPHPSIFRTRITFLSRTLSSRSLALMQDGLASPFPLALPLERRTSHGKRNDFIRAAAV